MLDVKELKMDWFQANAPIRQKMLIVMVTMIGLVAVVGLASALAGLWIGLAITVVGMVIAAYVGVLFRQAISVPYVATVVRMEGLAAGDLNSPIQFTEYGDCVGRMTKAMFTFRDTAIAQQRSSEEQNAVVGVLSEHLERLSAGDLTSAITTDLPPAYSGVKSSFNTAVESLRDLIGTVVESTGSIRTGSGEIAQASEDLARRTESNAASLEETSAAIAQIDGRLKASAQSASETVERANGAMSTVSAGRALADNAVQAMGRVAESAKGIDSVIEGLDKIAFQTRVLAMNAAVEAGRAGEAGRGFAVVADLVGALAMRSEEEAKRARDQLTATQTDVIGAVGAVQKVDLALSNISSDVTQVNQLLDQMAADNQAQSSAITEIAAAIGAMDRSTQQNAAMVEETSAAARNLSSEVLSLATEAARFRIDQGRAGAEDKTIGSSMSGANARRIAA
jgi:methyl-accepting chemotaxis protein